MSEHVSAPRCYDCGERAITGHVLPSLGDASACLFACRRHRLDGFTFEIRDWLTAPRSWGHPCWPRPVRDWLASLPDGAAIVELVDAKFADRTPRVPLWTSSR